ncbi:NAD(P)/FAD-dependent oxidoreductase [Paenibacillus sp. N3/727]|uniref:flavin-containing monooxygenase n=1 Tax=Paenibacillus sp. N3/727 TaxID=2925845 RepID=UPI001F533430|nr:NAD(P)-binding domain-containing protein [Paenibacillus sp. N3/727]UNK21215.1 NAD(P)/FAD-dependent oxidoreductase [Paenibacillus sp. N3/727]
MVWDTVVIGAGQAGLAVGYWLNRSRAENNNFLILDRSMEAGEVWQGRYESLRLFTPRSHNALPGLPLEGESDGFPDKNEMSLYLQKYAVHFGLPIQFGTDVTSVRKERGVFIIDSSQGQYQAKKLVIATGPFQQPNVPTYSQKVSDNVLQMHSSSYRHPSQLQEGDVLVVGGGNSGAQIAVELSEGRKTYLALGQQPKYLPLKIGTKSIFWWLDTLGILKAASSSWIGRRLRRQGDPIFGYELKEAVRCGKVILKKRTVDVSGLGVLFQDGSELAVRNIIWATGFKSRYSWLHIEGALDSDGQVLHSRGVSSVDHLYFVGLPWQTHRGSALLAGVGRDARLIVEAMNEKRE